jgi:hypothetical protein
MPDACGRGYQIRRGYEDTDVSYPETVRFQCNHEGVDWQRLLRLSYQRLGFEPFDNVLARFDRTKLYDT